MNDISLCRFPKPPVLVYDICRKCRRNPENTMPDDINQSWINAIPNFITKEINCEMYLDFKEKE